MAKGKKTGGKNFEKGHSICRPKKVPIAKEYKEIAKISRDDVVASFAMFLQMNKKQRNDYMARDDIPGVDQLIGAIFERAMTEGTPQALDFMLDRTIGKVVAKIEPVLPAPTIITRLNGDVVELGAEQKQEE